ncbi:hypothetical protein GN244_ATG01539 [Phytophthora infestans]|uniref:Uncharacterized protein n=1 Tax=Phytophthora infestans TaxID=4787 RepID=A0A833SUC5_PHYIN|nr:hypothetical protein GN244_ATG01539 [Phytophthora infestans]KAF4132908.1 hypothetical protein GN958_ATG17898 [Phytophthora infestans]
MQAGRRSRSCRKSPDSAVMAQDIRREYDGITTDAARVHVLLTAHIKSAHLFLKSQNDPLFDPPNDEDTRRAKHIQKDCQTAFKKKKREREAVIATAKRAKETTGVTETAGEATQTDGRDGQETVPASSKVADGWSVSRT